MINIPSFNPMSLYTPKNNSESERAITQVCTQLLTPREVAAIGCAELVREMCGIGYGHVFFTITFERLQQIVDDLKKRGQLAVLNSIPDYYYENRSLSPQTPLSYWIGEGNLDAVRLLVENGAAVRVEDSTAPSEMPEDCCISRTPAYCSALYLAAKYGQVEIIQFLLEKGASANFAFSDNLLRSFIPTLLFDQVHIMYVFQVSLTDEVNTCLKLIFDSLPPVELKEQFRIPLSYSPTKVLAYSPANVLAWIREQADFQDKNKLIELLECYGATDGDVLTIEQLNAKGYNKYGNYLTDVFKF